jgi:hypothetical protein
MIADREHMCVVGSNTLDDMQTPDDDQETEHTRESMGVEAAMPNTRPGAVTIRTDSDTVQQQTTYDDGAAEELTSIMLTSLPPHASPTSHPVSPGSSSTVPLQAAQHHATPKPDFTPPARPSSTPFPHPERRNSVCCPEENQEEGLMDCASRLMGDLGAIDDDDSDNNLSEATGPTAPSPSLSGYEMEVPETPTAMNLDDLPAEIHEAILDHLFGYRVSAASKSSMDMRCVTRSWGTDLRHSRRKELSELALVSPTWRYLIQERLYRHIKIRATVESIEQAVAFFSQHPHLQHYVKHMELWFPVFQRTPPAPANAAQTDNDQFARSSLGLLQPVYPTYALPMGKCTLQEAFVFVRAVLPSVQVLTLEGGERRKAPKVLHFLQPVAKSLTPIETVQTLVVKGQWNLMREPEDFDTILSALPNLKEWHGSYSRPKSKSYLSIAKALPQLPTNITQLHLCLEGEYRRELACPPFFRKVTDEIHFCTALAAAVPALEQFSYTGRICKTFFDALAQKVNSRTSRLSVINITARNVCRPSVGSESGCGIQDLSFMRAFEQLVLAGIRSLSTLEQLEYLRIRYIDLDSPVPPLNPFFLMKGGYVSGVWSESILSELQRSRPSLGYDEIRDDFGDMSVNKDGRMVISPHYPRARVLGLKLANYALLADGITMQH